MTSFVRLTAEVRFVAMYVCDKCSVHASGSTDGLRFDGHSSEELMVAIDAMPKRASRMPVGWSSHWGPQRDTFKCRECSS